LSKHSRSLSEVSRTSKKSVKLLNASLERVHTFGMAVAHKGVYDLEKIDNQYDSNLNRKKSINKTISHAKLENVGKQVNKEENIDEFEAGHAISVNIMVQGKLKSPPSTTVKLN